MIEMFSIILVVGGNALLYHTATDRAERERHMIKLKKLFNPNYKSKDDIRSEKFHAAYEKVIKDREKLIKDRRKEGEERKYNEDGDRLISIYNHKNNKLHGAFEEWHENGHKAYSGCYKDGKLHGRFTSHDTDGSILGETHYKDGEVSASPEHAKNKDSLSDVKANELKDAYTKSTGKNQDNKQSSRVKKDGIHTQKV